MRPQGATMLDLRREELAARLDAGGVNPRHAPAVWQHAHRRLRDDYESLPHLPRGFADRLRDELPLIRPAITRETQSSDGYTRKVLLTLADGAQIETVLMRYQGRDTVCVSTQAGCAMGCVFCATGQMGFRRHLTTGEIVGQILAVQGREAGVRNVVFMGMGEPLHNYDNVLAATEILADHTGLGVSPRRLTVSTVGVAPGIRRLAAERRPISLAVSLHAATQAGRLELLSPAAKAWPLEEVLDACRVYSAVLDRHIFFEWTLMAGRNDREADAEALAGLLSTQRAHVNLIPLNPTAGFEGAPSVARDARRFQQILAAHGIPSTIRQRRGIDIDSGCGQLAARTALPRSERPTARHP